jgi:signal transduction histidine kinase
MLDSANKKNINLGQKLLDGLNFELRTLLNGFVGPVQLLKYNTDDPSLVEIFRMLDSTLWRLERLAVRTSIVQNIDSISNQKQQGETINLVDLVKYCILDLQTLSDLENVTFNIKNDNLPATITGNYDLLLQAFEVLFELAISLSESNTVIEVKFANENQHAICKVTSHTATFPSEMNFEVDSDGEPINAPWDLLMAKTIINGHNGQIITSSSDVNSFIIDFSVL